MAWIDPTYVDCPKETFTSKKAYLTFKVTEITQTDGSTNQTTIKWQLIFGGGQWVALKGRYLSLGGKELVNAQGTNVQNWTNGQVLNSGSTTFDNNADGTISLSVFLKQLFYYNHSATTWANSSQSVTKTLNCSSIARYPVLRYDTVSTTLNSMTCGLSNTRSGTMTQFQVRRVINDELLIDRACNGSFSFTLNGLSPNTDHSNMFKVRAYANGGWGDWLTLWNDYDTTKALPSVSATSNISVDSSTTIQFTNLNYIDAWKMDMIVPKSDGTYTTIATRQNITTNNYAFTLTESEKTALLKLFTGTTKPYTHLLITASANGLGYSIRKPDGYNPEVYYTIPDNSTYQPDFPATKVTNIIDTLNTAITGSNTKFIKNHNKLQGTIAPMGLKYSATGKTYAINIGSKSTSLNYSTSNQNFTINNVDGNSIKIVASDSRGKTTTVNKSITLIDYANPTFTELQAVRQNGIDNYAIIKASGNYTNWSGLTKTNTISKVEYRWKLATAGDSTYSAWTSIDGVAISNGSWNIEKLLPVVFSNTERYYIQLRITDLLETITSQPFILSTANVFLWKDIANKKLGINKKPDKTLDVDGEIGCSAIYIDGVKVIWNE